MRRGIVFLFFLLFFSSFWIDFGSLKLCLECLSLRIILSYRRNSGVCLMVSLVIFRSFFHRAKYYVLSIDWNTSSYQRKRRKQKRRTLYFFLPPSPPSSLSLHGPFVLNDVLMNYSLALPWLLTFDQKRLNVNTFIEPGYIKSLNQIKIAAW